MNNEWINKWHEWMNNIKCEWMNDIKCGWMTEMRISEWVNDTVWMNDIKWEWMN